MILQDYGLTNLFLKTHSSALPQHASHVATRMDVLTPGAICDPSFSVGQDAPHLPENKKHNYHGAGAAFQENSIISPQTDTIIES